MTLAKQVIDALDEAKRIIADHVFGEYLKEKFPKEYDMWMKQSMLSQQVSLSDAKQLCKDLNKTYSGKSLYIGAGSSSAEMADGKDFGIRYSHSSGFHVTN